MKRELTKNEQETLNKKRHNFKVIISFSAAISIILFLTSNAYISGPALIVSVIASAFSYFKVFNYKLERELGPEVEFRKNCINTIKKNDVFYTDYLKFFNFMKDCNSHGERANFESFLLGQKEHMGSFVNKENRFKEKHPEVTKDFFDIVKCYPSVPEGIAS